jgi:hypothetical protein
MTMVGEWLALGIMDAVIKGLTEIPRYMKVPLHWARTRPTGPVATKMVNDDLKRA